MLDLDLIELKLKAKSSQEVIEKLGNLMLSKGYVLDSYVDAVLTREETLPTGLPIDGFSVAIPHTDSGHVNESTIAIATLEEPVEFNMMIDPTQKTKVQLVFLLAVKNPNAQVQLLKTLMSVFQNKELLMNLQKASSKEEVNELLRCLAV
ncbi:MULTISPECIES: PTS sugar transporter subunit IIA [Clostridium]|jgi:PTS system galactitol-specific IIA component|uniref:PTS sugar transporter subunit IIA n=1 Tax=Clostridium intestinale TaxID=36845 RepID=A0A7D6ZH62_9CLOT|nr:MULTISPECIES: PTS sugar transporter subunit IIA [Clostridium]QLY80321.1 PTS sugar transporter subunit IIA [Clostridium intestinale]WRY50986.1 PTS sugar transporter subunit IIA [Clostridium intestinale]